MPGEHYFRHHEDVEPIEGWQHVPENGEGEKKNAKSEVYIHHAPQMIDIKVRKCRKIKTQNVLCNSKYDQ